MITTESEYPAMASTSVEGIEEKHVLFSGVLQHTDSAGKLVAKIGRKKYTKLFSFIRKDLLAGICHSQYSVPVLKVLIENSVHSIYIDVMNILKTKELQQIVAHDIILILINHVKHLFAMNNIRDLTWLYSAWKSYNLERFSAALSASFKSDGDKLLYKQFLLTQILPYIFNVEGNYDKTHVITIELAMTLASVNSIATLTTEESVGFLKDLDRYLVKIMEIWKSSFESWPKLWIIIVRLLGIRLHTTPNVLKKMLKMVEDSFKMEDVEQRLRALDCWKVLIDNWSLDFEYFIHTKRVNLILTPLTSKLGKQDVLTIRRFEVFKHLLMRLGDKAVLVLKEFLIFCFGEMGEATCDSERRHVKDVPKLYIDCGKALLAILGHSHKPARDCFEAPTELRLKPGLLHLKNITHLYPSFHRILINSVVECCILLEKTQLGKACRQTVLRCLWDSLVTIFLQDDEHLKDVGELFGTILNKLMTHDDPYCRNLSTIIFKAMVSYTDRQKVAHVVLNQLSNLAKVIFTVPLSRDSAIELVLFMGIFSRLTDQTDKLTFVNKMSDCFEKFETLAANADYVGLLWILLAMHREDYADEDSLKFLVWPVLFFHHVKTPATLYQIRIHYEQKLVPAVQKSGWIHLKLLEYCKTSIKNDAKQLKIIFYIINWFNPKITDKEILNNTLEIIHSILLATNKAENTDSVEHLVESYICKLYDSNVSVFEDQDTMEKLYLCIRDLLKCKYFDVLSNVENFLKKCPEAVKRIHNKYLPLNFLKCITLDKQTNLDIRQQIYRIIQLFQDAKGTKQKMFVKPTVSLGGRSAKIAGLVSQNSDSSGTPDLFPLKLFGKDLKLVEATANKRNLKEQKPYKPSIDDENSKNFVFIDTKVSLCKDKMTEHQKEMLKKRRDDIPALYQDLSQSISQSLDSTSVNATVMAKSDVMANPDDSSKNQTSEGVQDNNAKPLERNSQKNEDIGKRKTKPFTRTDAKEILNKNALNEADAIHKEKTGGRDSTEKRDESKSKVTRNRRTVTRADSSMELRQSTRKAFLATKLTEYKTSPSKKDNTVVSANIEPKDDDDIIESSQESKMTDFQSLDFGKILQVDLTRIKLTKGMTLPKKRGRPAKATARKTSPRTKKVHEKTHELPVGKVQQQKTDEVIVDISNQREKGTSATAQTQDTETQETELSGAETNALEFKLDLPQKRILTESEDVISRMDTASMLLDSTETQWFATPTSEESSTIRLASSPVTSDTGNQTFEFLNNTSDISPIESPHSRRSSADSEFVENVGVNLASTSHLEDAPLESQEKNNSPQYATENLQVTDGAAKLVHLRSPPKDKGKATAEAQMGLLFNPFSRGPNPISLSDRPKTIMSPSSRIQKLMSNVKRLSPPPENIAEQEQERILRFVRPVPSPLALPKSSILKRKRTELSEDQSPVAKRKRKQVNFSDPSTTCEKVFITEQTESSKSSMLINLQENINRFFEVASAHRTETVPEDTELVTNYETEEPPIEVWELQPGTSAQTETAPEDTELVTNYETEEPPNEDWELQPGTSQTPMVTFLEEDVNYQFLVAPREFQNLMTQNETVPEDTELVTNFENEQPPDEDWDLQQGTSQTPMVTQLEEDIDNKFLEVPVAYLTKTTQTETEPEVTEPVTDFDNEATLSENWEFEISEIPTITNLEADVNSPFYQVPRTYETVTGDSDPNQVTYSENGVPLNEDWQVEIKVEEEGLNYVCDKIENEFDATEENLQINNFESDMEVEFQDELNELLERGLARGVNVGKVMVNTLGFKQLLDAAHLQALGKDRTELIKEGTLEELSAAMWDNFQSGAYDTETFLEMCIFPYIGSLEFTKIFELNPSLLKNLDDEEFKNFISRILANCTEQCKMSVLDNYSMSQLTNNTIQRATPNEVINAISEMFLKSNESRDDVAQMHRLVTEHLLAELPKSKIWELAITLLQQVRVTDN